MGQTLRLERGQNCTKSGRAIEEMTKEHTEWPCIRNGRRPIQPVCRKEVDQVAGSLELLLDFRKERGAEWPMLAHLAFKYVMGSGRLRVPSADVHPG